MITVPSHAAPVISGRFHLTFSAGGRYGTCLRTSDEHVALESWVLATDKGRPRTIRDVAADSGTHALPLDDGRILLFQRGGAAESYCHGLTLLTPRGDNFCQEELGTVPSPLGGYLVPSPSCAQLGFVVAFHLGHSTIWRISASPPRIELAAQVPGSLDGGVWLDGDARRLAINQTCGRYRCNGIAVDLAQGSWKRIWSRSVMSADRILLCHPQSRILIVSTTAAGTERLGWVAPGDPKVHFPEALQRPGCERKALALDDCGERLLVHEVAGAVSRLSVYTLAHDTLAPVAIPPGKITPPACWVGDLIRFGFSAPAQPPTLATVRLEAVPRWSVSPDRDDAGDLGAPPAELINLRGPAGPIEAIVYGGPDWRACEHLVVALHGGPLSSWAFGYEPLFHRLSAAGVAVLAPNYRGSTGYGEEHLRAVIGDWGGPDLDDVLQLARSLDEDRRSRRLARPVVLGISYGAFLALLAACHEPELWSACVALSPFLSGPRFHDCANVAVRRRIEKLGGLERMEEATGPRDVLRACTSLSVPLLLMHGTQDETIPVTQSRILTQRLLELGSTEGIDFEYCEIDTGHGGLSQLNVVGRRVVRFCLARSEFGYSGISDPCRRRCPETFPLSRETGRSRA
jgi:pimeloyl-ACP methyl ester carboxylesterase